ncbi:hypothetical protein ABPG72_019951 [Tetrahymena utriculariae]
MEEELKACETCIENKNRQQDLKYYSVIGFYSDGRSYQDISELLSINKVNKFHQYSDVLIDLRTSNRRPSSLDLDGLDSIRELPYTIPCLSAKNQQNRLKFCIYHQNDRFSNVFFTDKSQFQLFQNSQRVFQFHDEQSFQKPKINLNLPIFLWGCISKKKKQHYILQLERQAMISTSLFQVSISLLQAIISMERIAGVFSRTQRQLTSPIKLQSGQNIVYLD